MRSTQSNGGAPLTAVRTNEALPARWSEIDVGARLWTIPAARMKAGKEHCVPRSSAAIAVLDQMLAFKRDDFFPGVRLGKSFSDVSSVLRRLNRSDLTVPASDRRFAIGPLRLQTIRKRIASPLPRTRSKTKSRPPAD